MEIRQFEDKSLSHFSYAIRSGNEIALVDPARDPGPYYEYAKKHNATIRAVIETHPHADFVSSHLEIHETTGASIYVSRLLGAEYPHKGFDDGDFIQLGKIQLKSLNTPGHSPDSITILALDEHGKAAAAFTGDTLFIGDCGRPDLREKAGAITAARTDLARQMYHSLRNKLINLPDEVLVYPAHGAGSLCGKSLSDQHRSTIGAEKMGNWSLRDMSEEEFVKELLADQPFIPKYFPFDVSLNKKGAEPYHSALAAVPVGRPIDSAAATRDLKEGIAIIDTRPQNRRHAILKDSINLMEGTRFETWLGSIIAPGEKFYLLAEDEKALHALLARVASIGYEKQVERAYVAHYGDALPESFNAEELKEDPDAFTIVDIRNQSEVKEKQIFSRAMNIPLHELRERTGEIPLHKPIVVHCAGGYRSAAGASIIRSRINGKVRVHDLSKAIGKFS